MDKSNKIIIKIIDNGKFILFIIFLNTKMNSEIHVNSTNSV